MPITLAGKTDTPENSLKMRSSMATNSPKQISKACVYDSLQTSSKEQCMSLILSKARLTRRSGDINKNMGDLTA